MRAAALPALSTAPPAAVLPPASTIASGASGTAGEPGFGELLERQLSARRAADAAAFSAPARTPDAVGEPPRQRDAAFAAAADGATKSSSSALAAGRPAGEPPDAAGADASAEATADATAATGGGTTDAVPVDAPSPAARPGTAACAEAGHHGAGRAAVRRNIAQGRDPADVSTAAATGADAVVTIGTRRTAGDDRGLGDDAVGAAWLAALAGTTTPPAADAVGGATADAAPPGQGGPAGVGHAAGKGHGTASPAHDRADVKGDVDAAGGPSPAAAADVAGGPAAARAGERRLAADGSPTGAAAASFAAALSSTMATDGRRTAAAAGADTPAVDGVAAAIAGLSTAGSAAAAADLRGEAPVARAAIDTPIDGPGFAGSLGASVSLFAADGVQQAELHLNPTETGPIHVRITLDAGVDGSSPTQARVEFHAELLATRDAIEASLPGLAGAMREQGLTLAGGGVFQGTPGRDGGDGSEPGGRGSPGSRRRAGAVDGDPVPVGRTAAAARAARSGRVDLYA